MSDVRITPGSGLLQFKNASDTNTGYIQISGDDITIGNNVGSVLIGDIGSDVYIGDGVNSIDMIFEQDGAIRAEAGQALTLTLGSADTTLRMSGLPSKGSEATSVMIDSSGNLGYRELATVGFTGNSWDLTFQRSGVNVDTVGADSIFQTRKGTETNQGTWPGSYYYLVSFGDRSQGIQFSHGYGNSADSLFFRGGTDNSSSENGGNTYTNWRRVASREWVNSNYQPAGNYFTDGDTVLNMANNDGLVYNDTNNLMYIKADGTDYAIIDSRGGTVSGTMTFTGEIQVREGSPTISLIDTDTDADDFYIHVNSHNFYVLRDTEGANGVGSGWDGPHPLQLEGDTNTAYVFGSRLNIGNWDTAYSWGNHASAGYLSTTGKAADSNLLDGINSTGFVRYDGRLTGNADTVTYTSVKVWDVSTAEDDPAGASDGLLTTKYWDSSAWAVQSYHDFHTNKLFIRSKQSGTWQANWAEVWSTDNFNPASYLTTSGKAADSNLLDGIDSSGFMRQNASSIYTSSGNSHSKIKVWGNDSNYSIGMHSGMVVGAVNDYAMTFQMNNDADRGWVWRHSGQGANAGVASLTATGDFTAQTIATVDGLAVGGTISGYAFDSNSAIGLASGFSIAMDDGTAILGQVQCSLLTSSGDVTAFSDARVKKNVKTLENSLDKVTKMRGVSYNKIDSEEDSIGVIAQEIQEVLPEVVREDKDGMLSVAYGNITAILIEAIKEQQKQIDELKAKLDGITK